MLTTRIFQSGNMEISGGNGRDLHFTLSGLQGVLVGKLNKLNLIWTNINSEQ